MPPVRHRHLILFHSVDGDDGAVALLAFGTAPSYETRNIGERPTLRQQLDQALQ